MRKATTGLSSRSPSPNQMFGVAVAWVQASLVGIFGLASSQKTAAAPALGGEQLSA